MAAAGPGEVILFLVISRAINWATLAFKIEPRVSSLTPIVSPLKVIGN